MFLNGFKPWKIERSSEAKEYDPKSTGKVKICVAIVIKMYCGWVKYGKWVMLPIVGFVLMALNVYFLHYELQYAEKRTNKIKMLGFHFHVIFHLPMNTDIDHHST